MQKQTECGKIIILNGAPRSGKSSIVKAIQNSFDGIWINIGVDTYMQMIPNDLQPGIGLRPGGERPDLEAAIVSMYQAMYQSIRVHSTLGLNVVVDVGHHDSYSTSLELLPICANIIKELPVLLVGIYCPIDTIMERRINTWQNKYEEDGTIPPNVKRWQEAVHKVGIYDLQIDTSVYSPNEAALCIQFELNDLSKPSAINRIANLSQS
ncbi:chloramphenicol phosphotransferase CPT family protein [Virgibacillus salexigens]|uniref:chloramphenicol phosphotransferase CPT family protein n=1 Tax=Virgibacillus salexigens TaxID=61016 RepID=UPI00190BD715|nr:chloramphenicol phosphotransferase [Virgibacillus salexigens]